MIRIAFCKTNRLFILLKRAETEIRCAMANSMFKMKMDINRHGPRLMPNNCKHLNPPYFSLPITFMDCFETKLCSILSKVADLRLNHENLQICNLRISIYKNSWICDGGMPKNLQMLHLPTFIKNLLAHLWQI